MYHVFTARVRSTREGNIFSLFACPQEKRGYLLVKPVAWGQGVPQTGQGTPYPTPTDRTGGTPIPHGQNRGYPHPPDKTGDIPPTPDRTGGTPLLHPWTGISPCPFHQRNSWWNPDRLRRGRGLLRSRRRTFLLT